MFKIATSCEGGSGRRRREQKRGSSSLPDADFFSLSVNPPGCFALQHTRTHIPLKTPLFPPPPLSLFLSPLTDSSRIVQSFQTFLRPLGLQDFVGKKKRKKENALRDSSRETWHNLSCEEWEKCGRIKRVFIRDRYRRLDLAGG